jgi:hypothetical protein
VQGAIGGQQAGADDAPPRGARPQRHQVVGVARHVGAVKTTQSQMHNAAAYRREIVARTGDARVKLRQRVSAEEGRGHARWSLAVVAVVAYKVSSVWPGIHPKTKAGAPKDPRSQRYAWTRRY